MRNASEIHQKMCRIYSAQKRFSRWDSPGGTEAPVPGKTHYCVIFHEVRRTVYLFQTVDVVIFDSGRTTFRTNCSSCFIIFWILWKQLWKFFHTEKIDFSWNPSNPSYKNLFDVRKKYWNRFWPIVDENTAVWKFRELILVWLCWFGDRIWVRPSPKSIIFWSSDDKIWFWYFLRTSFCPLWAQIEGQSKKMFFR